MDVRLRVVVLRGVLDVRRRHRRLRARPEAWGRRCCAEVLRWRDGAARNGARGHRCVSGRYGRHPAAAAGLHLGSAAERQASPLQLRTDQLDRQERPVGSTRERHRDLFRRWPGQHHAGARRNHRHRRNRGMCAAGPRELSGSLAGADPGSGTGGASLYARGERWQDR